MTISSYPYAKLLIAMIAAIVVGNLSNSWGWGIGTFFIAMFLFIWVADWIFGGPIKGKVEVTDELEELLDKLSRIGNIKNHLPFSQRDWCNSLGLFVQLRDTRKLSRVQAGGKYHSQIDAYEEGESIDTGLEWKVQKYEPGDWEKLVDPTLEIAIWLMLHEGLPEQYVASFNKAIEMYKNKGSLKLPRTKKYPPKLTSDGLIKL